MFNFTMLAALKGVVKNRGRGTNVKKVVVLAVMYGSESWGYESN